MQSLIETPIGNFPQTKPGEEVTFLQPENPSPRGLFESSKGNFSWGA
jgi:hypothetical protein